MSKRYLDSIRVNSCYPAFRAFVSFATVLMYLIAAAALVGGIASERGVGILVGAIVAAVIALIARVSQEVSLMIADIADATIDSASHRLAERPEAKAEPPRQSAIDRLSRPSGSSLDAGQVETAAKAKSGGPVGTCPNCDSVIPLDSATCNVCKASFGAGSAWKIKPIR